VSGVNPYNLKVESTASLLEYLVGLDCLYALVACGHHLPAQPIYLLARILFKKEDELHQVKLNFFTNVSHEIRTHLTLIMAPVEKMQESEDSIQLRQAAAGLRPRRTSNRLLKLVSELMDFRKAETGHLKLQPGKHDLIAFLEDIYNSFQDLSIKKNITTAFIFDGQSTAAVLRQRATGESVLQPALECHTLHPSQRTDHPAGDRNALQKVVVKIIDNGRGIAAEYLDKVFTNFFQVDDHGLQNTGYGVGLALAKNIVVAAQWHHHSRKRCRHRYRQKAGPASL
jgi:signal transduction histidine kinase